MSSPLIEIPELAERLSELAQRLARLPRLAEQPAGGDNLLSAPLAGQSLGGWLEELWPGSAKAAPVCVSESGLAGKAGQLRRELAEARTNAEGLKASLAHLEQIICREKDRLVAKEASAQLAAREAAARLAPIRALFKAQESLCRDNQARREALKARLDKVRPQGLKRFVDHRGNPVSAKALADANNTLHKLAYKSRDLLVELAARQKDLANAELEAREAHAALTAVKAEHALARSHHRAKEVRLERVRALVQKRLATLPPLDLKIRIFEGLRREHGFLLEQAESHLAPALGHDAEPEAIKAAPALDSALESAGRNSVRMDRLGALMRRLDKRCGRLRSQVGPALKEQRRVNRELEKLEAELSGVLETMFAKGEGKPEHHRLAAGLTTLCSRAEALVPQAEKAQEELDRLELGLKIALERGKKWQAAWKEAGKSERTALAQAEALAIDAGLQAEKAAARAKEMAAGLEPVVRALTPLCGPDLAAPLAKAVEQAASAELFSREEHQRAGELKAKIPPPRAIKLSRPPMALKPLSTASRRLSGKRVELDHLRAVLASAKRFADLAMGPIRQEIRRPAEEVAMSLSASLASMTSHRNQLADENLRHRENIKKLRANLKGERDLSGRRQELLDRAKLETRGLAKIIQEQKAELKITRADQALARRLEKELFETSALADSLSSRLEHGNKLTAALKAKLLERHRLYRRSQYAVDWLDYWRDRAYESEKALASAQSELQQARREYREAKKNLALVTTQRDDAQTQLAAERAARSRQALDLLSTKALSVELAASQGEAGRWSEMARSMALALAASGQANHDRTAELRRQVDELSAEAAGLRKQLERISRLMDGSDQQGPPRSTPGAGPGRAARLRPEQVDTALSRLGKARRRLAKAGRAVAGHWAVIAALTGGLVFLQPGTPSKATRTDVPLLAPKPIERHLAIGKAYGPTFNVPASAVISQGEMGRAGLELNLMPLRATGRPLPYHIQRELKRQAKKAGLSPKVLMASAKAVFAGRQAVEAKALGRLADIAQSLAHRHPLIFRELRKQGLPATAGKVADLALPAEKAQHLFLDRLYREYRSLGFSAEESLGALVANERAFASMHQNWRDPGRYRGQVRPLPQVEAMSLETFLKRATPYIVSRLQIFLKQRGMQFEGKLETYAKNLAFDMYCAAKKFKVPLTVLMAIAHQETWYANVLGDMGKSASPFQIYEPTRELIIKSMADSGLVPPPKKTKLQRHLTMATFMAAFHVRELMQQAEVQTRHSNHNYVNMDSVMLRYNGSREYASRVHLRKNQLASYLRKNPG